MDSFLTVPKVSGQDQINPTPVNSLYRICPVLCISLSHVNLLLLCLTILKEIKSNLREQCV